MGGNSTLRAVLHGRSSALALACTASAVVFAAPAMAQDTTGTGAAETPAETTNNSGRLEEIIVTARRTNESQQNTPVSVTAVSGDQLRQLNVVRLEGVAQLAPSVRVTTASGSANAPALFIRGLGSTTTALYQEPAVALYLDGVYTPRMTGATFDLPDISSIEVLRGPQGTLFGRNTTGGAMLINTAAPTATFGGKADFSFGTNNEIVGSAVINTGGLGTDAVRMKFTASVHSRDGWVNTPGYSQEAWGGALYTYSFGWGTRIELGPRVTIDNRLRYNYSQSYTGWQPVGGSAGGKAFFGGGAALGGSPFVFVNGPYNPTDIQYRDPRTDGKSWVKAWGNSTTLTFEVSDALTIKEIFGFSNIDELLHGNIGGGSTLGRVNNPQVPGVPIQIVSPHTTTNNPGLQRQISSETQFTGTVGDFSYVAGLFLYRERTNETIGTIIDSPNAAGTAATSLRRSTTYEIVSNSYAGFGQLSYKPSFADGRLEISGGLRYTKDKKTLDSFQTSNIAATVFQKAANEWSNTGWLGSISYKVTPTVLIYARASSAYRSGGYNAPSPGVPPYDPETPKNYEAGFKTDLFDRHVRFNGAIYQTDFNNLQVNAYNQTTKSNTIVNAAKARIRGFELEAAARFGNFFADANLGHTDPSYQRYVLLVGGVQTDVTGTARFAAIPTWTWHAGGGFDVPFNETDKLTLRADYSYQSSAPAYSALQLSPNIAQMPFLGKQENLSARAILNLEVAGKPMRFSVFGENLQNNRWVTFASDFTSVYAAVFNRPRYYGASVGINF